VAIAGMQALVERVAEAIDGDIVLNAPVERITEQDGHVSGVTVNGEDIPFSRVISNIPLWSMPAIVSSDRAEVNNFFQEWDHMKVSRGLTLWLGLDEVVIGDRKSRVIVHPNPNRWMLSLSSFDPTYAPKGKELIGIATILEEGMTIEAQVERMKGNGLDEYYPEILDHVEMEHVQTSYATRAALIPGQTALDRPGPHTPINGLYIVGTDTAGEGVGLQQATNSAEGVVRALSAGW